MPATTHAPALRATYLLAFDNFATDPSEVASLPEVGNVRYARELLGLLVANGLLVEQDVNGEEIVWQVATPGTYDTATREQAVAEIDRFLSQEILGAAFKTAKATKRTGTASKRNPAGLPLCLCGCGTPGKSDYRPGHDARHAGNLARAVLAGEISLGRATDNLSAALTAKVEAQVVRGNTKAAAPKGKATPKRPARKSLTGQAAWVKIGRWFKQGEVTSTTVNAKGQEDANSEVCVVTYIGKGGEPVSVSVDTTAMDGKWGMGAVPGL